MITFRFMKVDVYIHSFSIRPIDLNNQVLHRFGGNHFFYGTDVCGRDWGEKSVEEVFLFLLRSFVHLLHAEREWDVINILKKTLKMQLKLSKTETFLTKEIELAVVRGRE